MDFFSREQALQERAFAVLGLRGPEAEGWPEPNRIKYAYYVRIRQHHPDLRAGEARGHEIASLINEAYGLLTGKSITPTLLKDDALVQAVANMPAARLEDMPTYEEWLKNQFLSVDKKSIWSY